MAAPKVRPLIANIPLNEQRGAVFAQQLTAHIAKHDGRYLRDDAGHFHVIIDGRRISLAETADNHALAELMLEACKISTLSPAARAAIQRLQVEAARKAGQTRLKRFSALSSDGSRLYVPLDGGKLLLVTAEGISCAANGENLDHFWVEHPCSEPLRYSSVDVTVGLADFERLLVDTQACSVPAMRWLVAMQAGLFPYIRHSCPARFLVELIGPTQSGKTSGARRFTLLHGLGDVKGDFTVAGLAALGDIGLLVLDNKEQANFNQPLIDFCLFLSTGAERGRALVDGQLRPSETGRPVCVITTIEGVAKAELRARCIEIQYGVSGQRLQRGPIEQEISKARHEIVSALMSVFARYFQIRGQHRTTPNPVPNFEEHFTGHCDLLRAFGEIAGKPPQWAEDLIAHWCGAIACTEEDDDELEHPILRVLDDEHNWTDTQIMESQFTYSGLAGKLYITEAAHLLTLLQKLNLRDLKLPRNAQGLSRRLGSCKFRSLTFLPTDAKDVPAVKRTADKRPIGFFRGVTE